MFFLHCSWAHIYSSGATFFCLNISTRFRAFQIFKNYLENFMSLCLRVFKKHEALQMFSFLSSLAYISALGRLSSAQISWRYSLTFSNIQKNRHVRFMTVSLFASTQKSRRHSHVLCPLLLSININSGLPSSAQNLNPGLSFSNIQTGKSCLLCLFGLEVSKKTTYDACSLSFLAYIYQLRAAFSLLE